LKLPENCSCAETTLGQGNLLAKCLACLGLELFENLRGKVFQEGCQKSFLRVAARKVF
jgi:hypothetical protein